MVPSQFHHSGSDSSFNFRMADDPARKLLWKRSRTGEPTGSARRDFFKGVRVSTTPYQILLQWLRKSRGHDARVQAHSFLAVVPIEDSYGCPQQHLGYGSTLLPANAVRRHTVTSVGALEEKANQQIRNLGSPRPAASPSAPGSLKALAQRVKAVPALLVLAV
jgi:hypothetical protein